MSNNNYRDYVVNLLAGNPYEIAVSGDYYQVLTASVELTLMFDDTVKVSRQQGQGGPADYRRVTLVSTVDQIVKVALGYVKGLAPYDSRGGSGGAGGGGSVPGVINTAQRSTPDQTVPAGTAAQLLPADAARSSATISVKTADGECRFGDSGVGIAEGLPAFIGDSFINNNRGAVWVYNGGAAPAVFAILEEIA